MFNMERFRELARPDLNRILSQDKLSEKDYCDLKVIFADLERSYTIEMFEKQQKEEEFSGYRMGGRSSYNDMSMGVAPYMNHIPQMNRPQYAQYGGNRGNGGSYGYEYSGHDQGEIFKSQLSEMMHTAEDANTRRVIQEAMDKLR